MEKNLKWKAYIRSEQNITAFIVALFSLIIICSVLYKEPRPTVIDYGGYTQILYDLGLERVGDLNSSQTGATLTSEEYAIGNSSALKLLQLEPSQTLIYPVRFLCGICRIFGVNFSTLYLAILLTIITIACIFSIVKSLYHYMGGYAAVVGFAACGILLDGNHLVYFNSLYGDGSFFVCLLLLIEAFLRIAVKERRGGIKPVVWFALISLLLMNSSERGIYLLPVVFAAVIYVIWYCIPAIDKIIIYGIFSVLAMVLLCQISISYSIKNDRLYSETEIYQGLFTGILEYSEEPKQILAELGLPEALTADIGKSPYLPEEEYVISPYSEEARQTIYSKISYRSFLATYRRHPVILVNILEKAVANSVTVNSDRFTYINQDKNKKTEWVERYVVWEWIRQMIAPKTLAGFLFFLGVNLIAALYFLLHRHRKRLEAAPAVCYLLLLGLALLQFLSACLFGTISEIGVRLHNFIILYDVMWIVILTTIAYWIRAISKVLSVQALTASTDFQEKELLDQKNPLTQYLLQQGRGLCSTLRKKMKEKPAIGAFLVTVVATAVMLYVMFCPRIGAYNNGDFGRMMTAMNLQYTQEDWNNADELALTKVIEKYDWVKPYDYTKIMYYHADLSQAWMSLIIKLLDNWFGLQFSTVYVAIIYVIILIFCFYWSMKALFMRFGPGWLWMALLFIPVIFDRDNLGWLNSLFGEGPAFVGLMMVVASSLHLISCERGKSKFGFAALLFSTLFFVGSKAQFTIITPFLLIWILILAIYHTPKKWWRASIYYLGISAAFLFISISALNVYKDNENISSPDTIYQSVFYGILMISDDPKADLIELGLDPALAVDAGKHAYLDKSQYYCAPRTPMAQEMIYSKISTFTILKFYLRHPDKLWRMMDVAAGAAAEALPDYILYVGQKTTQEHEIVSKMHLWQEVRTYVAADRFWQLIVIYLLVAVETLRRLVKKQTKGKDKLLLCLFLVIAGIGIIEFPLSTIGNGFADNTKQLYLFRLTYDMIVVTGVYLLLCKGKRVIDGLTNRLSLRKASKLPSHGDELDKENGMITDYEELIGQEDT